MTDTGKLIWNLSNAVTAFAVGQALVFAYILAKDEFRRHAANAATRHFVLRGSLIVCLMYAGGIWGCWKVAIDNTSPCEAEKAVWLYTTIGRTFAIVFFTIGSGCVGHWVLGNAARRG